MFLMVGGWSEIAMDTIKDLGREAWAPPSDCTTHLFQKPSICLWRGNASLWIRRMPSRPAEVDDVQLYLIHCVSLNLHT
jgi:hypothetical protein